MATLALDSLSAARRIASQLKRLKRHTEEPPPLEVADIQGLVFRGYGGLRCCTYSLLQVRDAVEARGWLGKLAEHVPSGVRGTRDCAVHIAFTHSGLAALGLPRQALDGFSLEFIGGMTGSERSRFLGDAGESHPDNWGWGSPSTPRVHALLITYAKSESQLSELCETHRDEWTREGFSTVHTLRTQLRSGREHFGFTDGISQPSIAGFHRGADPIHKVKAGEFVLGYRNEYDQYTAGPQVNPTDDPLELLPLDIEGSGLRDFGRNGSYLVVRQLRQNVPCFRETMDRLTRNADGSSSVEQRERLAAQIVGRWPSGCALVTNPWRDDSSQALANDFRYHAEDAEGISCPLGAHARRCNPRDSLAPDPGTEASIAINRRHRLLRRGRSYGPELPAGAVDDVDRGLVFVALNANLVRQFEFVQHSWIEDPRFNGLFRESDPLIGTSEDRAFSTPQNPVRARYDGLPAFVRTVGGGYFFLPGIRALKFLAQLSD